MLEATVLTQKVLQQRLLVEKTFLECIGPLKNGHNSRTSQVHRMQILTPAKEIIL